MTAITRLVLADLAIVCGVLALQLTQLSAPAPATPSTSAKQPFRCGVAAVTAPEIAAVTAPEAAIAPSAPFAIPSTHRRPCPALDFDRDGVADRLDAVDDSCGTGGCVYDVYFVHEGGDRFVGQIAGACAFELQPRKRGPADVIATWRLGATDSAITRYRFDGRNYREHSTRTVRDAF